MAAGKPRWRWLHHLHQTLAQRLISNLFGQVQWFFALVCHQVPITSLDKQFFDSPSRREQLRTNHCQMQRTIPPLILLIYLGTPRQQIIYRRVTACEAGPVQRGGFLIVGYVDIEATFLEKSKAIRLICLCCNMQNVDTHFVLYRYICAILNHQLQHFYVPVERCKVNRIGMGNIRRIYPPLNCLVDLFLYFFYVLLFL